MDFDSKYCKSQVNGTISIVTRKVLDENLKSLLEEGEGELFLTCIPRDKSCSPEWIVEVASELGEVYILRYKIDFSGNSRGYAYLQYINVNLKESAMEYLPMRFRQLCLPLRVEPSTNNRELVLKNVESSLRPWQVYQEMLKIHPFTILRVYEYQFDKFFYIFGYRNNDSAASAHQRVKNVIKKFGAHAHISWLTAESILKKGSNSSCFQQELSHNLTRRVHPRQRGCFKF
ncbi:APOBEC1 complementation factor [Drosophila sechellia]|uniref:APOBEC1 complementation factor n=1 Tax=Drosophila sechellia TaxID=7238 RepID=UPI0013DE3F9E|nr:APOBEC1 complementation factor [Drosophila sechellia]